MLRCSIHGYPKSPISTDWPSQPTQSIPSLSMCNIEHLRVLLAACACVFSGLAKISACMVSGRIYDVYYYFGRKIVSMVFVCSADISRIFFLFLRDDNFRSNLILIPCANIVHHRWTSTTHVSRNTVIVCLFRTLADEKVIDANIIPIRWSPFNRSNTSNTFKRNRGRIVKG